MAYPEQERYFLEILCPSRKSLEGKCEGIKRAWNKKAGNIGSIVVA
jgi:hypothetical protein